MKTALFVQSARSPGGRRKGLTLMEILIAVGVTMLGRNGSSCELHASMSRLAESEAAIRSVIRSTS